MRNLVLVAAALSAVASAQTITIPNGFAGVEGNSSTAYPWQRTTAVIHVQYCFDSTHFTNQGVSTPIIINRLKWRANSTTTASTGGTYSNVVVDMSTSPLDQAAQTTTFATNHGPDLANVFTGSVTVAPTPSIATTTPLTPNIFYVDFAITPFLYDPTAGDLVIDVRFPAGSWSGGTTAAMDCQTTGAMVSRMYNLTSDTAPTGTFQANVGPVIEVDYNPASGLYANFTANVTSGQSPLAVTFADQSFTSAPGGVTSWAWDFDGDAIIDSNLQNPTFVYNSCGTFNVSLTVNDGVHAPATLTKNAYISTDQLTADFTHSVIGAFTVQFTDTSNMPATAWAWDFNGDAVIDSTAQNPVWVYPNANPASVTLTATRNCKSSTVTKQVIPAQILTTNLAANNGGASLWTVYFNLDVLNPKGVNISSFDSITATLSAAFTVDVYLKLGTYSGFEYNPAPWTKVGTASGTSNPVANQPSNASFALPLHIPAGSYGVALRYTGISPRYVTVAAQTTVGNGDMSLTLGSAAATTVGPFQGTTTTVNTPRMWSGTLYYGTHNVTGQAGHGFFAPGCAGSLGVSHQTTVTFPTLGGTLSVNVDAMPFALGVMVIGFSNTISAFGPLPVDLGFIGAPGCPLRVSVDATDTVLGAGTTATWNLAIPNVPALSGALLYNQCAVFDPAANAFGFVTGDAAGWVLGS